jgi:hypothetical protein
VAYFEKPGRESGTGQTSWNFMSNN